jgi:hypothetical protein
MYRWCATYHWKAFDKGYNFASDFISIGFFHAKLWGPKIAGVLTWGIFAIFTLDSHLSLSKSLGAYHNPWVGIKSLTLWEVKKSQKLKIKKSRAWSGS